MASRLAAVRGLGLGLGLLAPHLLSAAAEYEDGQGERHRPVDVLLLIHDDDAPGARLREAQEGIHDLRWGGGVGRGWEEEGYKRSGMSSAVDNPRAAAAAAEHLVEMLIGNSK